MSDFRCAAIVLAAGASTRLGQPKQLLSIEDECLLHRTVRLAIEAGCSPLYVVLGFEAESMRASLADLQIESVLNPAWQEGMGSSLRAGMHAVLKSERQPDAVLLLVCDQPRLSASHLRALLAFHSAEISPQPALTASIYAGKGGVPAVFSSELFAELEQCSGDRGARDLIEAHSGKIQGIPWPAGAFDIDRPEDLSTIER
jgi:molybdenum cofactor cytidylyltransferase